MEMPTVTPMAGHIDLRSHEFIRKIEARDLQIAAIHEVGHAMVCLHFGYDATPYIYPNPYYYANGRFENPDLEPIPTREHGLAEKLWCGSCEALWLCMPKGVLRFASLGGWVAEQIEIHGVEWAQIWIENPWPLAVHLRAHIKDGVISPSDLSGIDRVTQRDLARVVRLLLDYWGFVLSWADEVMESPRRSRLCD